MNFRQVVKTIDNIKDRYETELNPCILKAQYNPERFHLWKSLHTGPKCEELNMLYSPHYKFLCDRNDSSYYNLQKKFRRNDKWIKNKISKFLNLLDDIKKNGIVDRVVVLETPIFENRYNNGFEIFEGHHRVSCALFLKIKKIPCIVIRR